MSTGPIRTMLAHMSPTWLSREYGEKLVIGLMGYTGDALLETATNALKAPWVLESTSPDDALPYVGDDENLPQYPGQTNASQRARLADAFTTWDNAGTAARIIAEFALLGMTARIYTDAEWGRAPTPWWSQFWLVVDGSELGPAPLCLADPLCGDGAEAGDGSICGDALYHCGDGSLCGVSGSQTNIALMRGIIRRFKAGEERCFAALIPFDGVLCGDGHTANDGSLCGGSVGEISMLV